MRSCGHGEVALHGVAGLVSLRNLPEGGCVCPADEAPMLLIRHRGVELDICVSCRSIWLDAGEEAKIRAILRRQRAQATASNERMEPIELASDGADAADMLLDALGSILDGIDISL